MYKIIMIVVSTLIAVNAILLFSNKSQITRTYYVNEYDRVLQKSYAKELEKEAVVVPTKETTITIEVETVNEILVAPGDNVQQGAKLALLKTDSSDKQRALWESEQQAYEMEQSKLLQIISSLESKSLNANSTSSTNASTAENTMDINVQVDVSIGDYEQAIAEAEMKLVEVERKIQIVSAQLSQEPNELALLSTVDGNVASIEERNGKYFIKLYSTDKSVLTFATESEWHQISEGQLVKNYSPHRKEVVGGTVTTKTQVPASESTWLHAYEQLGHKTEEPLYELRIQLDNQIESLPYAANVKSVVVTNEAQNAVRIKSKWLLDRADQTAAVYTLSNEGKIIRTQVTVPFDVKQYAILSKGLESESIVLNEDLKNVDAPAFLPFPMELPTWNSIKALSWKEYVKYLTYK